MDISTSFSWGYSRLALVMVWIYILPLHYLGKMDGDTRKSPLTKLYVGIWLYVLLYGFLETLSCSARVSSGSSLWWRLWACVCRRMPASSKSRQSHGLLGVAGAAGRALLTALQLPISRKTLENARPPGNWTRKNEVWNFAGVGGV